MQTRQPTLHIYYEPFVRSDPALRLLASAAIQQYTGNRPGSSGAVNIRYKQFWGDPPGRRRRAADQRAEHLYGDALSHQQEVNAYFAFDRENKKETNLSEPDPAFSKLPFIQGADVYVPGSPTHAGTVSFELISRGGGGVRSLNTPSW